MALQTVDKEADHLAKIMFVLRDDEIYDAWVRKARELGFTALDGLDPPQARVPSPDAKRQHGNVTGKSDEDKRADDQEREEKNETDASPQNNRRKQPFDTDQHSPGSERSISAERRSPDKPPREAKESEEGKKRYVQNSPDSYEVILLIPSHCVALFVEDNRPDKATLYFSKTCLLC